jgi:predicted CXXCH cytochrome family protein
LDAKHADEGLLALSRLFTRIYGVVALVGLVLVGVVWGLARARRGAQELPAELEHSAVTRPGMPWKNAQSGVKYVGDATCARCHGDIAKTFRSHPMGRSLSPIASAPAVGGPRSDGSVTLQAGPTRLTIERRGDREIHRETQLDDRGRVLAQVEADVKYALGSGSRGVAYLVEHDGRLFQSPISWFTEKKQWALSPGYEEHSFHFDRPIENHCLFCHSNRVQPIELSVNHYKEPIFGLGEAIGCERCHGPGELHSLRQEVVDGRDLTIVNPRHLEPAIRAAVCEQCHLLGVERIGRAGRDEYDYRPGLAAIESYAVYGRASEAGVKAVGHVEQMKASRCFAASAGRLGCTSCHDPHQVPSERDKTAFFRGRCLGCHDDKACALPEPARRAASRDDSCINCHMPKLQSTEIAHLSTTDHRILRAPQAPASDSVRAVHRFPLVLLNAGHGGSEPIGLGREQAIALAAQAPRLPDTPEVRQLKPKILSMLDNVIAENPDDLLAKRLKAQSLALSGRRPDAILLLTNVVTAAPTYEQALDELLTYALDAENVQAAFAPAQQAVALNPWSAVFRERLAYVSMERQDWDAALAEARHALRINPFLRFSRMFVVQCLLHKKDLAHAQEEFATLIELHPTHREFLTKWFADWRQKYKT